MKEKIKKIIFNKLSELSSNQALLLPDLQIAFQNATGKSLNEHLEIVQAAVDELESAEYARLETGSRMPRILKGVDFDKWGEDLNSKNSGSNLHIGSVNAQNVQLGDSNMMNINITPEEFVRALAEMQRQPERAKSVLNEINEHVKSGLNLGQTIAKFTALFS